MAAAVMSTVPEELPQQPDENEVSVAPVAEHEDSTITAKRSREEESAVTADKKWPGWPGDNVFRLLVPVHKVGGIIGRKGELVKKMCEETHARIKILDGVPGHVERVVMVTAKDDPEAALSPAMDGLLRVHKRIIEGDDGEGGRVTTGPVSTRLLVAGTQAGSLIGRQGSTIKSIQDTSGATVRVLPTDELPLCALDEDRVVEIQGEPQNVHKALESVINHLRKFLVDRSVLQLFEVNRAITNKLQNQQVMPNGSWVSSAGSSFQSTPVYGRDPGPSHGTLGSPAAPPQHVPVITQVTQHMQIPLSYADAIIGSGGSNISYMRRTSGATITVQETRGVPGEMTVEIHGSATQVQTAQQLIQNFMAGITGPSSSSAYESVESGYNAYNTQNLYPTTGGPGHTTGYAHHYNGSGYGY